MTYNPGRSMQVDIHTSEFEESEILFNVWRS